MNNSASRIALVASILTLGSAVQGRQVALLDLAAAAPPARAVWLDSLDITKTVQGYGDPHAGRSVDNNPLRLHGVTYAHGLGTHAVSELVIDLHRSAARFISMTGVDDEKIGSGSVVFQVWVDGKLKAITHTLHGGDAPERIDVDLRGAKRMKLLVGDAADGMDSDHADWAGAAIVLTSDAAPRPSAISFTPPPQKLPKLAYGVSAAPAIHGAGSVGTTPGRPFLFLVPATGRGPLTWSAAGLPAGLTLDAHTGILSGTVQSPGVTDTRVSVTGPAGRAESTLRIVAGDHKLAQTPPMGWNSWNVWASAVDDAKVRAAADSLVASGLAAHGFQYVNIDDCWEADRDANGEIQTNSKFPDMKALADYIHSKGLRFGIYSSPGPTTCGGYTASYQHEAQDAKTYAKWGVDYLKYDWCSYENVATGEGLERLQKPYRVMREGLDAADRDIFFSFCQYGMGDVWKWGAETGGNSWRTTGDITDNWASLQGIAFSQNGHEKFAGPGHWNDPDMLVVGWLGWGPALHQTHLTPNEQVTHISMWCLQSAPLLLGCDLTRLDRFTLSLLTNDEVLAVNQDLLGRPAGRIALAGAQEVWARPLADGTKAVGLFNRGDAPARVTVKWPDLGLTGSQPVRDLWQRQNRQPRENGLSATVPAHGAVLYKIGRPKAPSGQAHSVSE